MKSPRAVESCPDGPNVVVSRVTMPPAAAAAGATAHRTPPLQLGRGAAAWGLAAAVANAMVGASSCGLRGCPPQAHRDASGPLCGQI